MSFIQDKADMMELLLQLNRTYEKVHINFSLLEDTRYYEGGHDWTITRKIFKWDSTKSKMLKYYKIRYITDILNIYNEEMRIYNEYDAKWRKEHCKKNKQE